MLGKHRPKNAQRFWYSASKKRKDTLQFGWSRVLGGYGGFWVGRQGRECFGWVGSVLGGQGVFWVSREGFGWVGRVLGG